MYIVKVGHKWIGKPNKKGNYCLVDGSDEAYEFQTFDDANNYAELVNGFATPKA
ncbi:hypothetical protein ABTQ33_03765 [Paucilactobacillus suebicus]|uniref:Uncharacterized protein n=1 Tax=Paucilactobacillus suebicus DSM 5007 = KCTC 3549 TaxID=1423807 RepID=A0A0R1W6V2_9LACO|nr:hypothetical protein [Paucilactobacillus suebicus]KRM13293.1 hypothetical protein FD16_GL000768 [Paucilactobacillus suebicus DSM 5007 = KCTC 3549]